MNCPHCGLAIETKRKAAKISAPVDTATMTDTQLYAHYKKTSHIGDVAFFAERTVACIGANRIHEDATELLRAAEGGLARAETLRQLSALQAQWRQKDRPAANEASLWRNLKRYNAPVIAKRRDAFIEGERATALKYPEYTMKDLPSDAELLRGSTGIPATWPPHGVSLQNKVLREAAA